MNQDNKFPLSYQIYLLQKAKRVNKENNSYIFQVLVHRLELEVTSCIHETERPKDLQ